MKRDKLFRKKMRKRRIRAKISGTANIPRLSVFKGSKHLFLQIIDDIAGKTLVSASETMLGKEMKGTKTQKARALGKLIGERARAANIEHVVFDRGGAAYHGRIQAAAEGAREVGLEF